MSDSGNLSSPPPALLLQPCCSLLLLNDGWGVHAVLGKTAVRRWLMAAVAKRSASPRCSLEHPPPSCPQGSLRGEREELPPSRLRRSRRRWNWPKSKNANERPIAAVPSGRTPPIPHPPTLLSHNTEGRRWETDGQSQKIKQSAVWSNCYFLWGGWKGPVLLEFEHRLHSYISFTFYFLFFPPLFNLKHLNS